MGFLQKPILYINQKVVSQLSGNFYTYYFIVKKGRSMEM